MAFIDPIELLQLNVQPGQALTLEELRRAKRKLLAEFELSDGITIQYRGQAIDKSVALRAVEQLEDPVTQSRLIQLHFQPALLRVIRDRDLRSLHQVPAVEKLGDADFRKYISGQLAPEFNDLLGQYVRKGDWLNAGRVLNRLDLIDAWDQDAALKGVVNFTRLQLHRANEVAEQADVLKEWDEPATYSNGLAAVLNRLPKDYQHLRNQYGAALETLAIALAEKHDRNHLGHRIITVAASLDMDANTADRIRRNQLWLWTRMQARARANTGTESTNRSSTRSNEPKTKTRDPGCAVYIVILVAIFILRMVFSGSGGRSSNFDAYRYIPPKIEIPDFNAQERLTRSLRALDSLNGLNSVDSLRNLDSKPSGYKAPRYDTIFFRDLIFYETLNAFSEGKGKANRDGKSLTPSTGAKLYDDAIPAPEAPYDDEGEPSPLMLFNLTDKGCVYFFESLSGGQILHNYYVAPFESYQTSDLGSSFYNVRVYTGEEMREDVLKYRGVKIPAFTRNASLVTVDNDDDKTDHKTVEMIMNTQGIDFNTGKAKVKTLFFDENRELRLAH